MARPANPGFTEGALEHSADSAAPEGLPELAHEEPVALGLDPAGEVLYKGRNRLLGQPLQV
jgi:hypothetical protein